MCEVTAQWLVGGQALDADEGSHMQLLRSCNLQSWVQMRAAVVSSHAATFCKDCRAEPAQHRGQSWVQLVAATRSC